MTRVRPNAPRWSLNRFDLGVALVVVLLLFLNLGGAPLFDVDEGAFSEATREMIAHQDWGFTTLNGAPRFDKPILVYWLQAASVLVFGVKEFAFRLPSAVCACIWAFSLWAFVRPRLGATAGRLTALILATSFGSLIIGRAAIADGLLNMLMCLSLLDAWRYLEQGPTSQGLRALRRVYIWVGLGLLTKGPVAALVPGAVTLLYCASTGLWARWRRAALDGLGWLFLLTLTIPWYAYAWDRHGMDFVNGFLLKHNVSRYTSPLEGHSGSLLYYILLGPLLLWLPWSGLLLNLLARLKNQWKQPLGRFLWIWALFVLGFFSFSGTKLPHYLLYGSSPVWIGLAYAATWPATSRLIKLAHVLVYAALTLLMLGLLGLPYLLQSIPVHDAYYQSLALGALAALPPLWLWAAPVSWLVWLGISSRLSSFAPRAACGSVLAALLIILFFAPWLGEVLQGPIKRAALTARSRPEPVVQWLMNQPSFSVYREAETPLRAPEPGELALTRLDRFKQVSCQDCQILFQERGVLLIKRAQP